MTNNEIARYVAGFLFYGDHVLLIKKARPTWQAGKYNGVGGKVELGEVPLDAMRREFREETGWDITDWTHMATLVGEDRGRTPTRVMGRHEFEVSFFTARVGVNLGAPKPLPDEPVSWHHVKALPETMLPNLNWLIPMALHATPDFPLLVIERTSIR